AAWMVHAILVGCFMGLAGLALEATLRLIRLPSRFVWGAALGGTLLLVGLAPFRSTEGGLATADPLSVRQLFTQFPGEMRTRIEPGVAMPKGPLVCLKPPTIE